MRGDLRPGADAGHTVDHICVRTPDNVLYVGMP